MLGLFGAVRKPGSSRVLGSVFGSLRCFDQNGILETPPDTYAVERYDGLESECETCPGFLVAPLVARFAVNGAILFLKHILKQ